MKSLNGCAMISKVFITGQTFGETCAYVCQELSKAEVLSVEGVRGHDPKLMAEDFEIQHQLMPQKEKPVFHAVLSFPPGDSPGDGKMVEIARRYLEEIGMRDTQYALVKHMNKAHLHLHIVANRVNNEGKIIGQGLIIERGIKAAQKLTREYNLIPEQGKHLGQTNLEALHEPDAKRYRLYQVIKEHLPGCRSIEDLEKRLLEQGITTRYKMDPKSGQRCGISFRIERMSIKGSQVDKEFSFGNLQKTLELQLKQSLQLEQEERVRQESQRLVKGVGLGKPEEVKKTEQAQEQELKIVHRIRHHR
jgi:hypothetical protein